MKTFKALLAFLLLFLLILPPIAGSRESRPQTLDEIFLQISTNEIPNFAGVYIDEDGQLTVAIAGAPSGFSAEQMTAMASTLSRLRGELAEAFSAGMYRVARVSYDFRQLWSWRSTILSNQRISSLISFIDIDEKNNVLVVGVRSLSDRAEVARLLSESGIPENGFQIAVGEVRPLATLRDYVRPVVGGLQIGFSNYLCTLGFNAMRSGTRGYVVNSHCTGIWFEYDGITHYQPNVFSGYEIGNEQLDPPHFTGGSCPPGYSCRYSDAAFGRYLSSASSSLGKIARTSGLNSINIAGEWTVVGEVENPITGETLNKVGRTSGWTQGTVTNTCVLTNVGGTNFALLCQDFVRASSSPGDSGSPVFKIVNSSSGTVQLYGILWGGGEINGVKYFVFSNMGNIERELGDLTTFEPQVSPRINVVYPNGGETLMIGSTVQIQWSSQAVYGNVRIKISRDGGSTWSVLFSETANDGSEQWTVTGPTTNDALIMVESVSEPSVSDTSNSTFRIVEQAPQPIRVRVVKPNGGETLRANRLYTIRWSVSGGGQITGTQIYFSPNGGESWSLIATLSGNPGYYRWRVPSTPTTNGLIKVVVTNSLGQTGEDASDRPFRIR
ncbi:MAG: hypothetical protein RMJ28_02365 [Nitrososphaerota archaeon]|nr:S1 family peptidase [Candidatus Calditenuaceae archaeon]MDW8073066.1 hypothetical protein [Nitrososphaerota archaeon]